MEQKKVRSEKKILINESDWKKIVKVYSEVYDIADRLHEIFWQDHKDYKKLGREAENLRGIISKVDREKQEAKVKIAEIYEKGFRNGIDFVNYIWQFDYEGQEEYLVRNEEMKEGYGELWDRDIDREIKKDIKHIK
jgi:hypothetical protein